MIQTKLTNDNILNLIGKEVCVVQDFLCRRGFLHCSGSYYYLTDRRRNVQMEFTFQNIRDLTIVDKYYPVIDLNPS